MAKRRAKPAAEYPAWIRCELCDDFICTIHGEHVYDCDCPGIDDWAERNIDPYSAGGKPPRKVTH